MRIFREIDTTSLVINVVSGCKDADLLEQRMTWLEMRGLFAVESLRLGNLNYADYHSATDAERKADKDGLAWIPCSAHNKTGKRTTVNMDQLYVLVLDIDSGVGLADVRASVVGLEVVIHSSHSTSPEVPKWRVVIPLREPVPATRLASIFDAMQSKFDVELDATCGHDSAHLYYFPSAPSDSSDKYVFEHIQGELLDATALLAERPSGALATVLSKISPTPSGHVRSDIGSRNSEIFKGACAMFRSGMESVEVEEQCLARNSTFVPPLSEGEVCATVASAKKAVERKVLEVTHEVDEVVSQLNSKYAYVEKQGRVWRFFYRDFVHFDQLRQQYENTSMRVSVGGVEKSMNHAQVWQRSTERRAHRDVSFAPGAPAVADDCINLWEGWGSEPTKGDITPWEKLLNHTFGEDSSALKWFEQWLAYPIQHPGAKLSTAVVLWSVKQGVGKTMIGETIGKLYGSHFRTITAQELHGSFNGWLKGCQFVLGEENSSVDQRADANKLKTLITGTTVVVNEKYQPSLELTNCANFLFTSNHADAFYMEDADRRFFVWNIAADRLKDAFYGAFIDWRDNRGGLAALMEHLSNLDLTGFSYKGNAPLTDAKREMIVTSKSDVERWLAEVTEDASVVNAVFGREVAHLEELTEKYNLERKTRVASSTVSKAERRLRTSAKRRLMVGGRRKTLMSLANHERWDSSDSSVWAAEYEKSYRI